MTIFRRVLGPLVCASLVLAATGCTDTGDDAEIDITVHGDSARTWVLVGPVDRAEKLAEKLAVDLGAPAPFRRDGTAAGRRHELVLEVPHAAWVDPVHLEDTAAQDGFALLAAPAE